MHNKLLFLAVVSSLMLMGFVGWQFHESYVKNYHLTLATTEDNYQLGQAIVEVVEQQNSKIKIHIVETVGSVESMDRLDEGAVQLAIIPGDVEPTPSATILASLYREVFQLIVAKDSKIKIFSDLKGKRVALMPIGSGSNNSFWFLSEHYGLRPSDFKFINVSWEEASLLFGKGAVDAIFRVSPSGNYLLQDLLQKNQATLVPINQGKAMKLKRPYLEADIIPKGTYHGTLYLPPENLPTVGVDANLLARKDVDPKITQEITRILFEHKRDIVTSNPLAATISFPGKGGRLTLPIHPGAQAFYDREKPNFFKANTGIIGLFISITTLIVSRALQLRSKLLKKQKKRADRYNLAILDLMKQARQEKDLENLEELRENLFKIFKEIVGDLEEDRIDLESFQSFTLTWKTALKLVRNRELILSSLPYSI